MIDFSPLAWGLYVATALYIAGVVIAWIFAPWWLALPLTLPAAGMGLVLLLSALEAK